MALETKAARELRRLYARANNANEAARLARTEFHAALTAAHDGASYRELAQALGISHQRVHQLVTERNRRGP